MDRLDLPADIYQEDTFPERWVVEAVDSDLEQTTFLATFTGRGSRERAIEYARLRYTSFIIVEPENESR